MKELELIESEAGQALENAKGFKITNQATYDQAAGFIKALKSLQKKVEDTFKPIVSKAHAAWKEAKDQENKHLKPLQEAEQIVKRASIDWYEAEEKKRLEKERAEEAKAKAAEEKRRKELNEQADNWDAKGNAEKAEERREAAEQVYVAPKPVTPTAQKAEGQAIKTVWTAELIDLASLVAAVAEGKASSNFISANMVELNKQAKATKDTMEVPGVRFVGRKEMAVR